MSNVVYNVHSLIYLPSDVLHRSPLDAFSCFSHGNMMNFLMCCIHELRNLAQHSYLRICEAATSECLPLSATMDAAVNRWPAFADAEIPLSLEGFRYLAHSPTTFSFLAAGWPTQ